MGRKLPPGEAERRAAERRARTWSGANYKTYDPEEEGYGSYEQWAGAASAFANGEFIYIETEFKPEPKPAGTTEAPKAKPTHSNPDVAILGMDNFPADYAALKSAYRKAVFKSFQDSGSSDTSPAYVSAFMALTKAHDRLKRQKGWK